MNTRTLSLRLLCAALAFAPAAGGSARPMPHSVPRAPHARPITTIPHECGTNVQDNFDSIRLGDTMDTVVRRLLDNGYLWLTGTPPGPGMKLSWGYSPDERNYPSSYRNYPKQLDAKFQEIVHSHFRPTPIKRTTTDGNSVMITVFTP